MALIYGRPVNMAYVGSAVAAVMVAAAGGYLVWRWLESRRSVGSIEPRQMLGVEFSGKAAQDSAAVFEEAAGPLGSETTRRGEADQTGGMTGSGF